MPRTKGSRNKSNLTIDDKIQAITDEIENLNVMLSAKRSELKDLKKAKEEEEKQRIMDAITASGKSYEEILTLLNSENTEN